MIAQRPFEFVGSQEQAFHQKHQRMPTSDELDFLRGPVVDVEVEYTDPHTLAPIRASAVAFVDTGTDVTSIHFDWISNCVLRPHKLYAPLWQKVRGGVEASEFSIFIGGQRVSTHNGITRVIRRNAWEGYEDILLGRDVLASMAVCLNNGRFSLINVSSRPIVVRGGDPCCR